MDAFGASSDSSADFTSSPPRPKATAPPPTSAPPPTTAAPPPSTIAPPPPASKLSMVISLLQQLQQGQARIESQFELHTLMLASQTDEIAAIEGEITRIGGDIKDKHFLTPQQWHDAIDQMNDLFKATIDSLEENIAGGIKLTDGQAFIDAIKEVQTGVASDIKILYETMAGEI